MSVDVHAISAVLATGDGPRPFVGLQDDRETRAVLHDLRDMLFVIGGTAGAIAPGDGPHAAMVLGRIADAARQASDRARALADRIAAPAEAGATRSFDANARLRALRPSLEACLPPGCTLRLRLAVGLWNAQGDPRGFDEAVTTLLLGAARAMRHQDITGQVAILTSNRPSAAPNGVVRVSIVSDVCWMADDTACDRALHGLEEALGRCCGRLVRAGRSGCHAAAHIDLRRSWSAPMASPLPEAAPANPAARFRLRSVLP